ncbi:MAG: Fis family transcriptional regulator [Leptolyngbyaceae cyanobacterium CAN_BIN12]|nr:Fis family transcriptional regulator [Leptolyngbyaceae cyanobacterium CAN_BIN12]
MPSSSADSNLPARSLDAVQRDRFEMLSAYMDGEVTADERRTVEEWLTNDPTVQKLHSRLLRLRQTFQAMPVPVTDEKAVQQTVDAVLARVDRRPRFSVIWGGIALAAVAVGAISTNLMGDRSPFFQMAQSLRDPAQTQPAVKPEPLLIALDQPLIAISKTPVAAQADSLSPSSLPQNSNNNVR